MVLSGCAGLDSSYDIAVLIQFAKGLAGEMICTQALLLAGSIQQIVFTDVHQDSSAECNLACLPCCWVTAYHVILMQSTQLTVCIVCDAHWRAWMSVVAAAFCQAAHWRVSSILQTECPLETATADAVQYQRTVCYPGG